VCLCADEEAPTKSAAGGGAAAATLNFAKAYGVAESIAALCTAHRRAFDAGRKVVCEELLSS
jgi:hypothetical protein